MFSVALSKNAGVYNWIIVPAGMGDAGSAVRISVVTSPALTKGGGGGKGGDGRGARARMAIADSNGHYFSKGLAEQGRWRAPATWPTSKGKWPGEGRSHVPRGGLKKNRPPHPSFYSPNYQVTK